MKRPGLGDLAGRGAAYGSHPDLRKCSRHHHMSQIIHTVHDVATALTPLPPVCVFPHAALAGGRVANRGASQDHSHLGAPQVSARRERPGARYGAAERPSEADGEMRLHTGRSRRALVLSPGQGSPLLPLTPGQQALGSGYHDNG
jgi:hypothetical protein